MARTVSMTRRRLVSILIVGALLLGGAISPLPSTQADQPAKPSAALAPRLVLAFEARVLLGPPLEVGRVPRGRRRVIPIVGGTFAGSGLKGRVLPGGADWQIVRDDGLAELDARYALETDQGQVIYVQNAGIRHAPPEIMAQLLAGQPVNPALVYFRTVPTFETAAPDLQWLTRSLFIATGERNPSDVVIRFWRVE
jgi:Protein of unknown function (DUF3237)